MHMFLKQLWTFVFFSPLICSGVDVITFEGAVPLGPITLAVYQEHGFDFSAPRISAAGGGMIFRDSNLISPDPTPGYYEPPVNGSRYVASFTGSESLLRRSDGGLFELLSLDLAEYSSVFPSYSVAVEGLFANGTTIDRVITLDGHVDALPDPPDFEAFTFGQEWTDLTEVRFLAMYESIPVGISFDNIAVMAIPEPSVIALCILAMAVYLRSMRRVPD